MAFPEPSIEVCRRMREGYIVIVACGFEARSAGEQSPPGKATPLQAGVLDRARQNDANTEEEFYCFGAADGVAVAVASGGLRLLIDTRGARQSAD